MKTTFRLAIATVLLTLMGCGPSTQVHRFRSSMLPAPLAALEDQAAQFVSERPTVNAVDFLQQIAMQKGQFGVSAFSIATSDWLSTLVPRRPGQLGDLDEHDTSLIVDESLAREELQVELELAVRLCPHDRKIKVVGRERVGAIFSKSTPGWSRKPQLEERQFLDPFEVVNLGQVARSTDGRSTVYYGEDHGHQIILGVEEMQYSKKDPTRVKSFVVTGTITGAVAGNPSESVRFNMRYERLHK